MSSVSTLRELISRPLARDTLIAIATTVTAESVRCPKCDRNERRSGSGIEGKVLIAFRRGKRLRSRHRGSSIRSQYARRSLERFLASPPFQRRIERVSGRLG